MTAVLKTRAIRAMVVVLALVSVFAMTPLVHGHDIACAHDMSGTCAEAPDRMDKGDTLFDPAATPGQPGPAPAMAADASRARFEVLGTYDPGTGSLGDVWSHKRVAYLASWVVGCQGQGVRAIDLADPANPRLVSTFADAAGEPDVAGSWTEKVIVQRVNSPGFSGDLAVVSFQNCDRGDTEAFRGFGVYDVTNPAAPERLALVPTASRGSHEIWLESRPNAAYVYTAVINAESQTGQFGGDKDFQVWDVSTPTAPERVAQWGAWEELGIAPVRSVPGEGRRSSFVHSVIGDGRYAYLSYWDLGTVILDMTDPRNPVYRGRTDFGPTDEGNAHSAAVLQGGRILVQNDEDFSPAGSETREQAWGYPRFYAIDEVGDDGLIAPRELGTFELPTTRQFPAPDAGDYTVHDPKVRGNTVFFSWYAEGVVAVDVAGLSRGKAPEMIAQWKPELPNPDPSGGLPDTGQVWGVALDGNLVLAADQNSGLYVLKLHRGTGR